MKTTKVLALVTAALVAGTSVAQAKTRKGEGTGIAAGTVIGAIVGGPVGFLVGGGLGGWLGNKVERETKARDELEARYREADALAASLEALVASSETELEQMRFVMSEQEDTYRDALTQALDIQVYFHTGESTLDEQVAGRVEGLGRLMREFEDFSIVLEGHADPRGDDEYNEGLSAERAAAVREALIQAGMPGDKITTRATGERDSRATEGDLDAMALERRVDLSIVYPLPRENRVARQ